MSRSLRQLWNETLAEPVPQELLDVLERAAGFAGIERGEGSPDTDGGPNDGAGSIAVPQPLSEAPHNRFTVSTPPHGESSR